MNFDNDIVLEIIFEKELLLIEWYIVVCNDIERFDIFIVCLICGYFFLVLLIMNCVIKN